MVSLKPCLAEPGTRRSCWRFASGQRNKASLDVITQSCHYDTIPVFLWDTIPVIFRERTQAKQSPINRANDFLWRHRHHPKAALPFINARVQVILGMLFLPVEKNGQFIPAIDLPIPPVRSGLLPIRVCRANSPAGAEQRANLQPGRR